MLVPPAPGAETVFAAAGREVRLVDLRAERTPPLADRLGAEMGPAVTAVEGFWGTGWPREIVVVATGSPAQFVEQAQLDPRGQWADIAAVSVADSLDVTRRQAAGQRIVLAPGAATVNTPALRIVLAHELFHLAARAETAVDAPRWLTEGVADFVARPAAPLPPQARADTALPDDAALDAAGPARSAGYDRAWWFARFVADVYGADRLRDLYRRACGPGHGDVETALHQSLGAGPVDLRARWAEWLESHSG